MGAAQTREYVDRRYEDRDVSELPDAPVEALRGLGKRGGEGLRKALGVKTIRDLATNDFVLKAQAVLRLAEGAPAGASPTGVAPVERAVEPPAPQPLVDRPPVPWER
jgi:nucleotidyltransferase/DNA polymerase involved in DNA repair